MKRILALTLLLCLLAGCGAQEPYTPTGKGLYDGPGTPTPSQPQTPATLGLACNNAASFHPYESSDPTNRALFPLIYQGLFTVDANYQVQPMLCKSYRVSMDMRNYTFYPESAFFSDGQALTAQDVLSSLEAAKKSSFYAGRFLHVTTMSLSEDGGVTLSLDTPCENLPLLLDIPIIKSSQLDELIPLGTGPYILEETSSGKQLRRQPAWWCKAELPVGAAVIPLTHGQSHSQIRDLFEFSRLSMVCTDPGSDAYVDFRGDYELWESENGLFLYLSCHMNSKVFSNESVRSALTHAIDRDALVKKFFRGFAHSATLPASPAFPYYSQTLAEQYGYSPDKFAQAVADANLTGTKVTLLVNGGDSRRVRTARAISEMLTAGGLEVTISEKNGQDFINALKWGNFDLYLGQTKLSPNMDLTAFFAQNGSLNYGGITDVAAYAICLEALANSGNYQSLHKLVMDDGRLCPILFRSYAIYGQRGDLPGLSPARDNIFYYSLGKTMSDAKITE